MGAAGTGLGITDMAQVLATGQTWLRVPESVRFTLTGRPQPGVMSKDVILYLIGKFGSDFATYKSIEFRGDFVDQMSIASRTVMSNMGVEMGAKFSMFSADERVLKYLNSRTSVKIDNFGPDKDAFYEMDEVVDVSKIPPQVAKPHSVENVVSVKELIGTNSCVISPKVVNDKIIVFSAIDNLIKGASGVAIQNANIMFGLDESLGLRVY